MYSDIKRTNRLVYAAIAVLLAAVLIFFVFKDSGRSIDQESSFAIEEAIRNCALQCYVVEGVYPPNMEYMRTNYGLQVNTQDFYVTYDAFASNIPPSIVVTPKKGL